MRRALGAQTSQDQAASIDAVLASAAEDVLDHLLFRNAAPLPAGVKGSESFQRAFAANATQSPEGRALKDLSLHGQLFAHRCSFLIYSKSFESLPVPLKRRVLDRLDAVLREKDPHGRYAYLGEVEKRRILEILTTTLPSFARSFQPVAR